MNRSEKYIITNESTTDLPFQPKLTNLNVTAEILSYYDIIEEITSFLRRFRRSSRQFISSQEFK